MTQQERQALENFLSQLVQALAVAKNPQADSLIQAALAKQPDAAYLLVQRAMLLEQALEQAKARIAQLQAQGGDGFLPRNNPWLAGGAAQPGAAPAAPAAPAAVPASGFLGNVATTAAGVVAGSFLFQGLEHLLHPRQEGWLADSGSFERETVAETTVINNYYGDAQPDAGMDTQLANFVDDGGDAGGGDTWI